MSRVNKLSEFQSEQVGPIGEQYEQVCLGFAAAFEWHYEEHGTGYK